MKKPTFEQYVEIGNEVQIVYAMGVILHTELAFIFGNKSTEPFSRINDVLIKMRSKMDYWVHKEFSEKPSNEVDSVFNGPRPNVKILDELPIGIKHDKLTYEQYKLIGNELKRFREMVCDLALKSQYLHGKTAVRTLLNLCGVGSPFTTLINNLQLIEYKDLATSGIEEPILFDVFFGDFKRNENRSW